jgi:hypothetical protein
MCIASPEAIAAAKRARLKKNCRPRRPGEQGSFAPKMSMRLERLVHPGPDPRLQALETSGLLEPNPVTRAGEKGVSVFIHFWGDPDALAAKGVQVLMTIDNGAPGSCSGTAWIPVSRLEALDHDPDVIRIEESHPVHLLR